VRAFARNRRAAAAAALMSSLAATAAHADFVHREKSLYRNIYVYEEDGLRCMTFGRSRDARQTCMSLAEHDELVFNYARLAMGALYLAPEPRRILVVGLGGGTLVNAFRKLLPAARIDAVEIDPAVVRVARRYFDFAPDQGTAVFEEDGRVFVKRMQRKGAKYDLVVLDAFDHDYIPEHMLTREFLLEVKSLLAPRGVLVGNTYSSSRLYDHESATYASVFGAFFNLKKNNRVILWRDGGLPARAEIERNAEALDARLTPLGVDRAWLLASFETGAPFPPGTRVLTDQYAPSNLLNGQ
jgi:spermidine synthase